MVSLDEKRISSSRFAVAEWISLAMMLLAGLAAAAGFWPALGHIQKPSSNLWFAASLGLAFFCLGFGVAYGLFARYRIAQSRQLAGDFDRLAVQAENIAKRAQQNLARRDKMQTAEDSD
jgi:hypothetical protein